MNELTRKFKGVWIPADIWLDRDLSLTEKVMLTEIDSLQDEVRGCYATNAHFSEFFGLSISRVSEIISSLEKKGRVRVEQVREGKRNVERRIYLVAPFEKPNTPSEKASNPFGKGDEPPSEKAKGSNTRESNTGSSLKTSTAEAFERFWQAGMVKTGKKTALAKFEAIVKREHLDPDQFADRLISDVQARLKIGQFGFDKLHPTTYLNQERWHDEIVAPGPTAMPAEKFDPLAHVNRHTKRSADHERDSQVRTIDVQAFRLD